MLYTTRPSSYISPWATRTGLKEGSMSPQKGCEQQQSSLIPRALRMAFFSLKSKVASDSQSPGGTEGWGTGRGRVFAAAQKKELILKGVKSTHMDASSKAPAEGYTFLHTCPCPPLKPQCPITWSPTLAAPKQSCF